MTKYYQVFNDQHQPVDTFESLDAAKQRIHELRVAFSNEGFYTVELPVVYSNYPAHSRS